MLRIVRDCRYWQSIFPSLGLARPIRIRILPMISAICISFTRPIELRQSHRKPSTLSSNIAFFYSADRTASIPSKTKHLIYLAFFVLSYRTASMHQSHRKRSTFSDTVFLASSSFYIIISSRLTFPQNLHSDFKPDFKHHIISSRPALTPYHCLADCHKDNK